MAGKLIGFRGRARAGKDLISTIVMRVMNDRVRHNISTEEALDKILSMPVEEIEIYNQELSRSDSVISLALADELKKFVSGYLSIPIQYFYEPKDVTYYDLKTGEIYESIEEAKSNPAIYINEISAEALNQYYNEFDSGYPFTRNIWHLTEDDDFECKYIISIRELLVYWGTYIMRHRFTDDILLRKIFKAVDADINKGKIILITDVRYDNEVHEIFKRGGKFIYISREVECELQNIAENSIVASEGKIDFIFKNEIDIKNNKSALLSLIKYIDSL